MEKTQNMKLELKAVLFRNLDLLKRQRDNDCGGGKRGGERGIAPTTTSANTKLKTLLQTRVCLDKNEWES